MIYVTGGTGLLGSHLLFELVKRGKSVRALRRSPEAAREVRKVFGYYSDHPDALFENIEWVDGDLLDVSILEDHLNGIEEIYHAAAIVSFDPRDRQKMESVNIHGTSRIVDLAVQKKIRKFCFVSSVAAIGPMVGNTPANENCIWEKARDSHRYSWTKFKSEMEVWRGIEEGLQAVIVNPSIIFGPGNWHRGPGRMFARLYKGLALYPPGITGYVDVHDVVDIMIGLMDKEVFGERFIINSEDLHYKEVFTWMAEAFHNKPPSIQAAKWMLGMAWRMMWFAGKLTGSAPTITRESARAGFNIRRFSNGKIKNRLGYSFMPVKDSVKRTAEIYLREKQD